MGITKPCTHLHPAPYTSIQLHPGAISPNLGQKIKSCPFWLKTGTHGILEDLILNPDLDFWNSDPKTHFWANLSPKIQSCPLCLKIGTLSISRMLISNPDFKLGFLKFWSQNPFFGKFGPNKSKSLILSENWCTWYLKDADSYSNISFLNFKS